MSRADAEGKFFPVWFHLIPCPPSIGFTRPYPSPMTMNWHLFLKATTVQVVLVFGLALVLALALPKSFFESWGWLSGPVAWLICATGTALILRLALPRTLLGAMVAGIPSLALVALGLHWAGALLACLLFGVWCGLLLAPGKRTAAGTG